MSHRFTTSLFCLGVAALAFGCEEREIGSSSGIVPVDGIGLPYVVEGNGTPLLVTCDPEVAQRAFSLELRSHLKFVFMEPRVGIKHERRIDYTTITMDTLVDDIERVRTHLELENIAVLGHSICGILALEYARRYPTHVSHVIMIGTPPGWNRGMAAATENYWNTHASVERQEVLSQNREALSQNSLDRMTSSDAAIAEYLANAPEYWHDPRYDASWLFKGSYWNVEGWNHLISVMMADYDVTAGGKVEAPMFLALGQDDYVVPPALWDNMRGQFPTMSYMVFERSGHFPHLEQQELFDQTLLAWIVNN
jgi:proline iminopeptidase